MQSTGNYHAFVKAHMMTYDLYLLVQERQGETLSRTIWGDKQGEKPKEENRHIISANP